MKPLTFNLVLVSLYLVPLMGFTMADELESKVFDKSFFKVGQEDLETQSADIADQYDSEDE